MDSEAQGAVARLSGLLDDLDDMSKGSIGKLETRLATARAAIEKARKNRGGQPVKAKEESGASAEAPKPDADMTALQSSISTYEARIAELEAIASDVAAKDARIAELEGVAAELEKRDALIVEHEAALDTLRNREAKYEGVDAKLAAYNDQVLSLENTVKEREGWMEALRGQLQERDAQIESLRGQLQERDQQSKTSEGATKEIEAQLAAAKEQLDALTAEVEKKDVELHGQQEAVVLLKDEVRQRDASVAKLEEKIQQGNAEAAALREQLEKALADNAVEELQRDRDEKTEKLKSVEGALRTTEEDRAKLELEVKMLLGEIEGMRYEHSELEILQGKVARLESDLEEERSTIVRLKAQQKTAGAAPVSPAAPPVQETTAPEPAMSSREAAKRVSNVAKSGKGRRGGRKQMGEILVEAGVLTDAQLEEVIKLQAADPKQKLGSVVVERGYATEEVIAAALAAQMHVRFIDNLEQELQPGVIKLVPNHLINNHRCIPLSLGAGQLLVAMANPLDLIGIENIELATNLRVEVAAATPSEIDEMIARYFNRMKTYQ